MFLGTRKLDDTINYFLIYLFIALIFFLNLNVRGL